MPRLKVQPETAHVEPEMRVTESDAVRPTAARADMPAHRSPALALQAGIEQSWEARHGSDAVQAARIPFGWTLIGASILCAAFWYMLLQLIF